MCTTGFMLTKTTQPMRDNAPSVSKESKLKLAQVEQIQDFLKLIKGIFDKIFKIYGFTGQ